MSSFHSQTCSSSTTGTYADTIWRSRIEKKKRRQQSFWTNMNLIYLGLVVQQKQRIPTLLFGRLFRKEHNDKSFKECCLRKQLKQKESPKLYSAVLEERRVEVPSRHTYSLVQISLTFLAHQRI
ncbi:hypothetical protein CMV_006061 [Castanea mollissima]|uniref:Uncharacterized protein n=1 Tax=Castanea mollissima TaxID=60419 RepID=A0A8J4VRL0_9ROSI|nr:hypothetical protein CMV_006061 [Castanea mollissima]